MSGIKIRYYNEKLTLQEKKNYKDMKNELVTMFEQKLQKQQAENQSLENTNRTEAQKIIPEGEI